MSRKDSASCLVSDEEAEHSQKKPSLVCVLNLADLFRESGLSTPKVFSHLLILGAFLPESHSTSRRR
jgi:hypothetical protein